MLLDSLALRDLLFDGIDLYRVIMDNKEQLDFRTDRTRKSFKLFEDVVVDRRAMQYRTIIIVVLIFLSVRAFSLYMHVYFISIPVVDPFLYWLGDVWLWHLGPWLRDSVSG